MVELHCDHLQIGLEPVGMDEIWGRAIEHRFGGATARILANDDLFVQLCVHLRRHGYERLGWFKDLDLMVRSGRVNWQAVREKATVQGCLDSVSYALWLLPRMLGTPLPREARRLVEAQGQLLALALSNLLASRRTCWGWCRSACGASVA